VQRTAQGVDVSTDHATQRFDQVIIACHPPATLSLLGTDATPDERRVLSSFRYQPNTVTLHTDSAIMPHTRAAWSAWNYRIDAAGKMQDADRPEFTTQLNASTHYWMNALQGVSHHVNYFVSLNDEHVVDPTKTLRTIACEHPLFDLAAREAQADIPALNAAAAHTTRTYFAGAWHRYGFHDDGLLSSVHLAELLLHRDPWAMP
jgi:predicted NAD/FAD-binding protein